MRYILSLLAILSAHQAACAVDQLHSSLNRTAKIEILKAALDVIAAKENMSQLPLNTKEYAAIIEQFTETPDHQLHYLFLGTLKALGREKTAALTTEQINKIVNILYLYALETAQEKEFGPQEIAKELAMEQYSPEVRRALALAGYVRNLVVEEATRSLFDYTWSAVANRLVKKQPNAAQPAQP